MMSWLVAIGQGFLQLVKHGPLTLQLEMQEDLPFPGEREVDARYVYQHLLVNPGILASCFVWQFIQ